MNNSDKTLALKLYTRQIRLNNPHFQVEVQTVREQESRYSQRHFDRATRLRLIDL